MRALAVALLLSGCQEPQTAVLKDGTDYALFYPSTGTPCASAELEPTLLLTVEGWFRVDPGHTDTVQPLAAWGNVLAMWLGTDGRIYVSDGDDGPTGISAAAAIDDGGWHHVALTWDTFDMELFVDGALLTSGAVARPGGADSNLTIGCWPGIGSMEGLIDEVRLTDGIRYTDSFTPEAPLDSSGVLLDLWHFDDGIGTSTTGENGTTLELSGIFWESVDGAANQGTSSGGSDSGR